MTTEPNLRPGVLYVDGKAVDMSRLSFTRSGAPWAPDLERAALACPPEPRLVTPEMVEAGYAAVRQMDDLEWECVAPERVAVMLSAIYRAMWDADPEA